MDLKRKQIIDSFKNTEHEGRREIDALYTITCMCGEVNKIRIISDKLIYKPTYYESEYMINKVVRCANLDCRFSFDILGHICKVRSWDA